MNIFNILALFGFISSITISSRLIFQHLTHFYQPQYQLHVCRILLMIPVYSIQAYISFQYPVCAPYLEIIRDCYEAYVISTFSRLLITYIGGEDLIVQYFESKEMSHHPWPVSIIFSPFACNRRLYWNLKRGIAQFIIIKPTVAVITLIIKHIDWYKGVEYNFGKAYLYLITLNNISTGIAMYSLLLFYICTRDKLSPFGPFSKFLCVKAIVFFSFWQAFFLTWAIHWKWIEVDHKYDENTCALIVQDWLICLELPFLAVAHAYTFPSQEFSSEGQLSMQPLLDSFRGIIKIDDVVQDTHDSLFKSIEQKEYKLKDLRYIIK